MQLAYLRATAIGSKGRRRQVLTDLGTSRGELYPTACIHNLDIIGTAYNGFRTNRPRRPTLWVQPQREDASRELAETLEPLYAMSTFVFVLPFANGPKVLVRESRLPTIIDRNQT